ncbi:hypothetical protein NKJ50_09780 [Mesorhizobium sp. M0115]|uniref:hypothetical protein n=1 Tax=Mesorhizobium sp. M0115 TaxID=2956883 RepID=UPI0033360E1C
MSKPESKPKSTKSTARAKAPQPQKKETIATELRRLVTNVSALRLSLSEVLRALESRASESEKAIDDEFGGLNDKLKIVQNRLETEPDTKGEITIKFPVERFPEVLEKINHHMVVNSSIRLVKEGHILSLVSKWDEFIAGILRIIYDARPEIISGSERSLNFSEMSSLKSIEDARKMVIDMECESVLRESHSEQFAYLEKKLGTKLREDPQLWPKFIEITQRRNLVAHVGSRVSRQYLDVCGKNKVEVEREMVLGSTFLLSDDYIYKAADCLIEIGTKLGQIVWNKVYPDALEEADRTFLDTTFQLISSEQYALSSKLLLFFISPQVKHAGERNKLMAIINLAQSLKWMGDEDGCQKYLNEKDWTVLSDDFQLAEAVLRDNSVKATEIMERIGKSGVVKKADYDAWPLFKKLRSTEQFVKTYQKLFGDEAEIDAPAQALVEFTNVERTDRIEGGISEKRVKSVRPRAPPRKRSVH